MLGEFGEVYTYKYRWGHILLERHREGLPFAAFLVKTRTDTARGETGKILHFVIFIHILLGAHTAGRRKQLL